MQKKGLCVKPHTIPFPLRFMPEDLREQKYPRKRNKETLAIRQRRRDARPLPWGCRRFGAEIFDLQAKAYEGTSGDEGKNTTVRCFYPRSNENRKRKDGAGSYAPRPYFRKGKESEKARKYNKKAESPLRAFNLK